MFEEPQNQGAAGHVPPSGLIKENPAHLFFWMALPDSRNSATTLP